MALDDYLEPEVGVAIALTAAVSSPKVRGLLRQAAVYGVAGALMAGDAVGNLARGVKQGWDQGNTTEKVAPERPQARSNGSGNGRRAKTPARKPRRPAEAPKDA